MRLESGDWRLIHVLFGLGFVKERWGERGLGVFRFCWGIITERENLVNDWVVIFGMVGGNFSGEWKMLAEKGLKVMIFC